MNILELSEQEIVRRQCLQSLRDMGIDPYPAAEFPTNAFSTDIKADFKDEDEPREVVIAGRMMGRRVMGKASFAELQDSKGRIQVYVARDEICPDENKELYNTVFKKLLDIGDFIGVKGFVFRTQTGEISVHAKELVLLLRASSRCRSSSIRTAWHTTSSTILSFATVSATLTSSLTTA